MIDLNDQGLIDNAPRAGLTSSGMVCRECPEEQATDLADELLRRSSNELLRSWDGKSPIEILVRFAR